MYMNLMRETSPVRKPSFCLCSFYSLFLPPTTPYCAFLILTYRYIADVPGVPPFDAQRSMDGERGIAILRALPASSEGMDLAIRNKVIGVYHKGSIPLSLSYATLQYGDRY